MKMREALIKDDILDKPAWVVVNNFSEEGQAKLLEDAHKVLRYNKTFLPVLIDSFGGEVYNALGMYDILRNFDCDVITVVIGKAMSAGTILFCAGDYRYISENSTIMIHQVSSIGWGKEEEFRNESEEVTRLNDILFKLLDKRTKQKRGYWKKVLKENEFTDIFLTAKEAREMNLATHIGLPEINTHIDIKRCWIVPDEEE